MGKAVPQAAIAAGWARAIPQRPARVCRTCAEPVTVKGDPGSVPLKLMPSRPGFQQAARA